MAIEPNYNDIYQSKILDYFKGDIFVKAPPFNVLQGGCLDGGSDYDGRRNYTLLSFDYEKKTPVGVMPYQKIYAFPTESPENHSCVWIFLAHYKSAKKISKKKTEITFQNDTKLVVPISKEALLKQVQRTSHCANQFEYRLSNNFLGFTKPLY